MTSVPDEEEMVASLTAAIIKTLEIRFDKRIKSLEHIVLRQGEDLSEVRGRMKSLGRLEKQVSDLEDRVQSLNREIVTKQSLIDRLGTEQGFLWKSFDTNVQILTTESRKKGIEITNLQSALEKQPVVLQRLLQTERKKQPFISAARCASMIQKEGERMMKIWENQFDNLAVFVHSALDSQTSLISEVQTKTLHLVETLSGKDQDENHVQYKLLSGHLKKNSNAIQKLNEEQEVTLTVFVETMANMKQKFEAMIDELPTKCTENNLTTSGGSTAVESAFQKKEASCSSKCKEEIKKVRSDLLDLTKAMAVMATDADEFKDIMEDSLQALADRMEATSGITRREADQLEKLVEMEFVFGETVKNLKRELRQAVLLLNEKTAEKLKQSRDDEGEERNTEELTPITSNTQNEVRKYVKVPSCHYLLDYHVNYNERELIDLTEATE